MTVTTSNIDNFIAPPCLEEISILYQDKDILLIDKPSGLLSLSGKNPLNFDSVHYRLVNRGFPTATLVHRLDFGTSGIMLVALNKSVNALLTKQFQARTVAKHYEAILDGQLDEGSGYIDLPIAKDKENFPLQKICQVSGKSASSEYKVLERLYAPDCCRVQFTPHTGRTHQLRIHSLQIGHPIWGCDLYKNKTSQKMSNRLLLHASVLQFDHPVTGERIDKRSTCPF